MGANDTNRPMDDELLATIQDPDGPRELRNAYAKRPGALEAGASIVEQLVTPPARARILDVLLSSPDEAWTVRELADRHQNLSKSSVSREKDALVAAGVIVAAGKKGNAETYRLNRDHPVTQLLRMLSAVTAWGRTPNLLDAQWIADGGDGDALAERLTRRGTDDVEPAEAIATIRVPLSALRDAYEWNREHPNAQRTKVLKLSPPFDRVVEASVYTSEAGNYYPPEMDPKPIHIRPSELVDEGGLPEWPTRSQTRRLIKEEGKEPTDERVNEWLQEARDVFWTQFGGALADEVDLLRQRPQGSITVDVEYTD